MHKPQFVNGHFYHVYNRGVEKRDVFLDELDYFRAIHDLFEFNDTAPAGKFSRPKPEIRQSEVQPPTVSRELLVKIHCFCLMPNHYHLILEQVRNEGIVQFMQKFGTGYTMYFNERNQRVGSLFQGRFKAILVENDNYLLHLSRYIHLNPVELVEPNWKEKGIKTWRQANRFLESYRWSSYPDYIGRKNFPSIVNTKFVQGVLTGSVTRPSPTKYQQFVQSWLTHDSDLVNPIAFE